MQEIFRKLQFRFNQSSLEELDDEALDDDVSTVKALLSDIQTTGELKYPENFKIYFLAKKVILTKLNALI